jgi:hypothetical protein
MNNGFIHALNLVVICGVMCGRASLALLLMVGWVFRCLSFQVLVWLGSVSQVRTLSIFILICYYHYSFCASLSKSSLSLIKGYLHASSIILVML